MVKIKGVKREFVVKGMIVERGKRNVGMEEMERVERIGEKINEFNMGYMIGKRINEGGRIGDEGLGERIIKMDEKEMEDRIEMEIERINKERKEMEEEMIMEEEEED